MRTRIACLSALFLLFVGQIVYAQVTGVVQDGDGFPVADAEVSVKGTDNVVYTGGDGAFYIDAEVGQTLLVVDAIRGSSEYPIAKKNMGILKMGVSIELEVVQLNSVFDRKTIMSGTTVVASDQIEDLNTSVSIDQMLEGKVSGLHSMAQNTSPGSVSNVVIRGALGLNGGVKSPLYVVDGTYMNEDDVNSINPEDIEEVRILKEASQLAVYGSRGANGVVIISTKRAKRNNSSITYKARFGFSELVKPHNIELMSSRELMDYQNKLSTLTDLDTGDPLELGISRTPEEIAFLSQYDHSWYDAMYKTGTYRSHHVSIQNGTENTSSTFSLGYDVNSGIVNFYDGFERITSSFNNSVNVTDKLRYGISANGSYFTRDEPRDRNNIQNPFFNAILNYPYVPVYQHDESGNLILDADGNPKYSEAVGPNTYPVLDEMENQINKVRRLRLFGSGYVELDLFKNLTARTQFGATYDRFQQEIFLLPSSRLAELLGIPGSKTDASADRLDYNWRNELRYAKKIKNHDISITVASEYINNKNYFSTIRGQGFPNDFQDVQVNAETILQTTSTNRWQETRFGYLAAMNYNFNEKYFLDAFIRRDGTSLAGFGNQYGVFWGASVGWDVAKEGFMLPLKWLNSLQFRSSYGELGDDSNLTRYANFTAITQGINYNGSSTASYPNFTVANDLTTWETNKKFNVGLQFSMLKRKLNGKLDYFVDKRSDFLFISPLSAESGSFQTQINAGELQTNGYEIELNYDVLDNSNGLRLEVYGNFTNIKYNINDLNGLDELLVTGAFESMIHQLDAQPYSFYLVKYAGVDPNTGEALYYDLDGNIGEYDSNNRVNTGKSSLPTMYGGFGLNSGYKGFELNIDFTYSLGSYAYNNTYQSLIDPTSASNKDVNAVNYWQQPGDNALFQRPTAEGIQYSDQFLENSSYTSLRSIMFGYDFNRLIRSTMVKRLKVFAQVQNVFLWTRYHGTPIAGTGASESVNINDPGYVPNSFTNFSYPLTRTYSMGINVTF